LPRAGMTCGCPQVFRLRFLSAGAILMMVSSSK
jgi:hypothetical protein